MTLRHPLTTWLKILLGWSLGGLLLFWLLRHVDGSGIAQSAAKLPVWLWLFWLAVCGYGCYGLQCSVMAVMAYFLPLWPPLLAVRGYGGFCFVCVV